MISCCLLIFLFWIQQVSILQALTSSTRLFSFKWSVSPRTVKSLIHKSLFGNFLCGRRLLKCTSVWILNIATQSASKKTGKKLTEKKLPISNLSVFDGSPTRKRKPRLIRARWPNQIEKAIYAIWWAGQKL